MLFRSQFKAADRSGARLALVVGPDEAAAGTVAIKDLRAGGDGRQDTVAQADAVDAVRARLGPA